MATGRKQLAACAAHEGASRGRRFAEREDALRSAFQLDRERIVHSTAFRRLEYKTQVFVNHEGDLFRTRLTHSIEVAQIASTLARALGLNEDLTEAIALAHDLGHTPFGHAGQDALNECMTEYGGFEHNLQSLRVVDELEEGYAEFTGLNLTFETREGILKHCQRSHAARLGDVGRRFLVGEQPGLEAQLTNLADEIAYNAHDVDDGLRSGLIDEAGLSEVELFRDQLTHVQQRHPDLACRVRTHIVVRGIIEAQIQDLLAESRARLADAAPADIEAIRTHPAALIAFSDAMQPRNLELKHYLRENLYRHYRVRRMAVKSKRVVRELFTAFMDDPLLLPGEHSATVSVLERASGPAGRARGVADYIAGMTDRYAFVEHERLYNPRRLT